MEEPSITQIELKNKFKISLTSVKRIIKTLQEKGKIKRMGSN